MATVISGITATTSPMFTIDSDGYKITLSSENDELVVKNLNGDPKSIKETSGGTGQTAYTQGDILYANAANTLDKLPVGIDGYHLTVSGGVPSWTFLSPSISVHNETTGIQGGSGSDGYYHLTSSEHTWLTDGYVDGYWTANKGGTGQSAYITGDILYGNPAIPNTLAKLPIGDDGYVLTATPSGPSWAYVSPSNYLISFVNGDLDLSGNLTITHNLGSKYVVVEVYDENDEKIIPASVSLISTTSCQINIASMQPLTGTWHAIVFVGGTIPSSRSVNRWFLASGSDTTSSTGWVTIGAAYVDPTNGPPASYLRCILECTSASYPCIARLYNADDAAAVGGILGEITETALTPTLNTLLITAGVTAGFPYAAKLYFFQIKMSGGSSPDFVACKNAVVEQS